MKHTKIKITTLFIFALLLVTGCEDNTGTPESATISGTITFTGYWPNNGNISISAMEIWNFMDPEYTGIPSGYKLILESQVTTFVGTGTHYVRNPDAYPDGTDIPQSELDEWYDFLSSIEGDTSLTGELLTDIYLDLSGVELADYFSTFDYTISNLPFSVFNGIAVSWTNPDTNYNSSCNQSVLGGYGAVSPPFMTLDSVVTSTTNHELSGIDISANLNNAYPNPIAMCQPSCATITEPDECEEHNHCEWTADGCSTLE